MDIESLLRKLHKGSNRQDVHTALDEEGRVRLYITEKDIRHEYIMVGDRFIEPPTKAPTQRLTPAGVDAFGGMGAR
jgi:hypothetical protein